MPESGIIIDRRSLPSKTILLVDGHDGLRITTKWFFASLGYIVESVRSGQEALAVFDAQLHDLVITDNAMPGMTGAEMAHIIKMRSPSTPVLMLTGEPLDNRACLDAVVHKPIHLLALKEAVEDLFANKLLEKEGPTKIATWGSSVDDCTHVTMP